MTRFKRTIGACTLAGALFQTVAVYATTYYVATTGSNSNPGTEERPWQTIAYAVNAMFAGDTTYVRGGTYNEGVIRFNRSGTQTAPIKLLNYPSEGPIISCAPSKPGTGPFNRIVIINASGSSVPIEWIAIEGFEIKNCWDGIKFQGAKDLTIRRNWIHDNTPGQGILGFGTRIIIDRNVINHNGDFAGCAAGRRCNQEHGIYGNGTAWTISNNLIYDNIAHGIQINGSGSSIFDLAKHPSVEYANTKDWLIANNTFAYSVHQAAIVIYQSVRATRIENNIFYENGTLTTGPQAIYCLSPNLDTFVNVRNNLSYASGSGATEFISGCTLNTHYTESGNVVGNPGFVNGGNNSLPASPNFALTERSPAIDKGLTLSLIKTAFDGTMRPQAREHDIGAYEYKAGGDAKSPNAPVALRAH